MCKSLLRSVLAACVGLVLGLGPPAASAQPIAEWKWVDHSVPNARYRHAAAYDWESKVMVIFGGDTGETDVAEYNCITGTWSIFTQPTPNTPWPSRRGGLAMAYDSVRDVVVMAGGDFNGVAYKDTWLWSVQTHSWTQGLDMPQARSGHAMVFDSARGNILVYGGGAGLRDLLVRTAGPWTSVTTAVNANDQTGHTMAFDAVRQRTVLVEGASSANVSANVFECYWTGSAYDWIQRSFNNVSPKRGRDPSITFDSARGVCVLVEGDDNNGSQTETWIYPDPGSSGAEWKLVSSDFSVGGGDKNTEASLVFDTYNARALLFGGVHDGRAPRRYLLSWNGSFWGSLMPNSGPHPIAFSAMAFDRSAGRSLVVGGHNLTIYGTQGSRSDGWTWDGSEWLYPTLSSFAARGSHSLVYDPTLQSCLMFGGGTPNGNRRSDLVEFKYSIATGQWAVSTINASPAPQARSEHAAAYDPVNRRMILFGGFGNQGALSDTWSFDSLSAAWVDLTPGLSHSPSIRGSSAFAYDTLRGVFVLFGGNNATSNYAFNDTWEFDGLDWKQIVTPHSPPGRRSASMYFEPRIQKIVMLMGANGPNGTPGLSDLWVYDGLDWEQLVPAGVSPGGRFGCGGAYDTQRQRFVLVAGKDVTGDQNRYYNAQSWELEIRCPADFNRDGFVNGNDYDAFAELFDTADPDADFNADGFVNGNDYDEFADHFDTGC
ncbi:MAG: hypothetical protein IT434_11915 [Phycisphaerales bacterium]|jgi:hypothetical protein|nr:hypothetical protein [Phycisphaerales bacterium]